VAFVPATQNVAPGAGVDLSIQVVRAGSKFNAFDLKIGYDPAALSQGAHAEGSYFTAACSNRYHIFYAGADYDSITDVLLCNQVALTGPGEIYHLHFTAPNTPQTTMVRFLGVQFYNEGLYVNPDSSSDATINVGVLGVGDGPSRPLAPRLRVSPNPSSASSLTMSVDMNRGGVQQLLIMDLQGRIVRHLQNGFFEAGSRTVSWDRMSDSGSVVSPGVYMAALKAAGKTIKTRFTVLN
jgi:hypothetical protein